ncbi:MAG TPA: protein kinase [Thermomicrobiales bacterium]|nr:protein kinase [Thermomicrobiales bacterium]
MSELTASERYIIERTIEDRESVLRQIAVDRLLGREVLITRLRGRGGRRTSVQQEFRAGAERAARLNHQHIVAMFDVETENGLPLCVQEHAQAESLRDIIDHEGPFHPDDVAAMVAQVADALDYAVQRGVAHGALRPETIVVDYDGTVLISDFGIGPVLDAVDEPTMAMLTYRSPEMLAGQALDARSDRYALGVIAYEMLTGQVPFTGETIEALAERIKAGYADAPSSVNPEVPPALSGIVLAALARDPSGRYQFAGDFADALTDWREAPVDTRLHPAAVLSMPGFSEAPKLATDLPDVYVPILEDEDDRSSAVRPVLTFAAWFGVILGLALIVWIGYQLLNSPDDSNRAITRVPGSLATSPAAVSTAPSLIGMTVEQAETATGQSIRVIATEVSETTGAGGIIRQSPNPGEAMDNEQYLVVVSSGTPGNNLSDVDVAGQPFSSVASSLTSLGFNVIQVEEGSATIAEGNVIRIEEASADPGADVHVVISMGDKVQIPITLQSMPVDDAVAELSALGLDVQTPIGVSRQRIQTALDLDAFQIVDGDVVGIQETDAEFGAWVPVGSAITPVFYDAALDS